jgi:hypothetical protein
MIGPRALSRALSARAIAEMQHAMKMSTQQRERPFMAGTPSTDADDRARIGDATDRSSIIRISRRW